MKMSKEQYSRLEAAIVPLISHPEMVAHYQQLQQEEKYIQSPSRLAMRFRWDLFWASRINKEFYDSGLDDNHIDTALRKIIKENKK